MDAGMTDQDVRYLLGVSCVALGFALSMEGTIRTSGAMELPVGKREIRWEAGWELFSLRLLFRLGK